MDNGFITTDGWCNDGADFGCDGTHPSNVGYRKMAAVWVSAFNRAVGKGFISDPAEDGGADGVCQPSPGAFSAPFKTQQGSGFEDGPYVHKSTPRGTVVTWDWAWYGKDGGSMIKQFHFAQLVNLNNLDPGGETDELILVLDPEHRAISKGLSYIQYKLNDGGKFDSSHKWIPIDVGTECLNRGVRWGDVNGDGLDDFICLNQQGNMYGRLHLSSKLGRSF